LLKVESLLLEAARHYDESPSEEAAGGAGAEAAPPRRRHLDRALPAAFLHGLLIAALPIAALFLSQVIAPTGAVIKDQPVLGARVAVFSMEREVRNLRLVLEMYRTIHDRYPANMNDLIDAGLMSTGQVQELTEHEIRYRSLRGGARYFLHSGRYGPLVRLLPAADGPLPGTAIHDPSTVGSWRSPSDD